MDLYKGVTWVTCGHLVTLSSVWVFSVFLCSALKPDCEMHNPRRVQLSVQGDRYLDTGKYLVIPCTSSVILCRMLTDFLCAVQELNLQEAPRPARCTEGKGWNPYIDIGDISYIGKRY